MGAVVGGLYASGLTAARHRARDDIGRLAGRVPRPPAAHRSQFPPQARRSELPREVSARPQGPASSGCRAGWCRARSSRRSCAASTLPVAQIQSFDDLAIPFRAIATDIVTGDRVVIDHGDLTTAMRASLSAPGVFSPVELDGRLLVDGGLSSNLPIDVAREMGVDILIVVDCGFPLLERGKLDLGGDGVEPDARHPDPPQHRRAAQDAQGTRRRHRSGARGFLLARFQRAREGDAARRGGRARRRRSASRRLSVPPAGVPAHRRRRARPGAATCRRSSSCASSPGRNDTPAPSSRCSATRSASSSTCARLERRVGELYGQGNLEILDYRLVQADPLPAPSPSPTTAWRSTRAAIPGVLTICASACSCRTTSRAIPRSTPPRAARWPRSRNTAANGCGTCRSARRRASRPRCICRWVIARAGSWRRTRNSRSARCRSSNEDERILAEYRVRTTDFGLDLGRELGNYGEIRVGAGRTHRRGARARRRSAAAAHGVRRRTISSASSATTPSTT